MRDIRIFTTIEKLRSEVAQIQRSVDTVLRVVRLNLSEDRAVEELPENIKFPLQTVEEVSDLELQLADTSVFKTVVRVTLFLLCCFRKAVYFRHFGVHLYVWFLCPTTGVERHLDLPMSVPNCAKWAHAGTAVPK